VRCYLNLKSVSIVLETVVRRRVLDDAYDNPGYLIYGYAIEDLP